VLGIPYISVLDDWCSAGKFNEEVIVPPSAPKSLKNPNVMLLQELIPFILFFSLKGICL
jgi:hypothetical protein